VVKRYRIHTTYSEDISLGNGLRVRLRPIRPDDKSYFVQGFKALSEESRYRRCLLAKSALTEQDLKFLTEFDGHEHFALGCTLLNDQGREIEGVAGARFVRFAGDETIAELAITVVDHWQRHGVGTALLERLCEAATERGVQRLRCYVFRRNSDMRRLIQRVASEYRCESEGSTLEIEFPVQCPATAIQGASTRSPAGATQAAWYYDPYAIARVLATEFLFAPAAFACAAPALWWRSATEPLLEVEPDSRTGTT